MESLNSVPVAVGVGILIGFVVGWFSRSGSGAKSKEKMLQESKDEMEQYRKDVTTHFEKTAILVGAMTEQYRAVYDHLADGAQNLCNDPTARLDAIGQGEALIAAHSEPEAGRNAKSVTAEVAGTETSQPPTAAASSVDETEGEASEDVPEEPIDKPVGAGEKAQVAPEERAAS